ncbi:hypothetical protein GMOD_00002064 [Pyrenophora seminiperda CCB06]|uniref:Uncharacterized protein n=1 Tax=Pyrenophora seminiperda CCB06 TaxID=1302712 RepID=A0A3M7LWW1_9PLEO|nr:hypothetical protein GMOD_00002064 [Pyrenophora seminiperda CCB06]
MDRALDALNGLFTAQHDVKSFVVTMLYSTTWPRRLGDRRLTVSNCYSTALGHLISTMCLALRLTNSQTLQPAHAKAGDDGEGGPFAHPRAFFSVGSLG